MSVAWRNALSAGEFFPILWYAVPRLFQAVAEVGSRSSAFWYSATASSIQFRSTYRLPRLLCRAGFEGSVLSLSRYATTGSWAALGSHSVAASTATGTAPVASEGAEPRFAHAARLKP